MDIYETRQLMKKERKTLYDMPLRVTYYARVSTTSEAQLNSIENQEAYFIDKIRANTNWQFVPGYVDEVRGESVVNRSGFLRMIDDARNGHFDYVLTKEISRFARDIIDSLSNARKLLSYGVALSFENDGLDTIQEDSELRLGLMASIAQDEVRKLSSRVKFGQARAIAAGKVLGNSRIWGYEKDNGRLVINEAEAEMVRKIFNLYVDGNSQREIERLLWAEGYRGREGGRVSFTSIGKIIKNPKYKGFYCGGKVVITDYVTKKQKYLPEEEWTLYKDESGEIVPAIVSEEIWDEANRIMADKAAKVKSKETSFKGNIYTGKVYCGIHNVPFWKNSFSWRKDGRTTKPQWRCSIRSKVDENNRHMKCETVPIFEYELNEIVKKLLMSLKPSAESPNTIRQYVDYYKQANEADFSKKSLKLIGDKIQKLQQKKERLLELNLEGHLSNAEFAAHNKAANEELKKLEQQYKHLHQNQADITSRMKSLIEFQDIIQSEFDAENEQFITKIVNRFIHRIVITPAEANKDFYNVDVVLNTGDSFNIGYDKSRWRLEPMGKKMVAFAEQALSQGQTSAVNSASTTIRQQG